MNLVLAKLVTLYQYTLGLLFPPACRFYPTCSCYAKEALQRHGTFVGLWLSVKRIARCHPWHPGGHDPVP